MDEIDFQNKMEAARAQIKGTQNQHAGAEPTVEQRPETAKANREADEPHVPSQTSHDINRDVDEKDNKPLTTGSLIADLEKKGAADLLKDENTSRYFQEYPFLFANAGDLTIDDVESLLSCYKKLVLKYVALSKGMGSESLYPLAISMAALEYAVQTETKHDNNGEVLSKMPSSSEDSVSHTGGTESKKTIDHSTAESSARKVTGDAESEKIADGSATESSGQTDA